MPSCFLEIRPEQEKGPVGDNITPLGGRGNGDATHYAVSFDHFDHLMQRCLIMIIWAVCSYQHRGILRTDSPTG